MNLVIRALDDEDAYSVLQQRHVKEGLINEDVMKARIDNWDYERQEKWASWFKNAIIDTQIAYWRDKGLQGLPTGEQLVDFKSCVGGALNRLIHGLNLLHPDVVIKEGKQTLKNLDVYKENVVLEDTFVLPYLQQNIQAMGKDFLRSTKDTPLQRSELEAGIKKAVEDALIAKGLLPKDASKKAREKIDQRINEYVQAYLQDYLEDDWKDILEGK